MGLCESYLVAGEMYLILELCTSGSMHDFIKGQVPWLPWLLILIVHGWSTYPPQRSPPDISIPVLDGPKMWGEFLMILMSGAMNE